MKIPKPSLECGFRKSRGSRWWQPRMGGQFLNLTSWNIFPQMNPGQVAGKSISLSLATWVELEQECWSESGAQGILVKQEAQAYWEQSTPDTRSPGLLHIVYSFMICMLKTQQTFLSCSLGQCFFFLNPFSLPIYFYLFSFIWWFRIYLYIYLLEIYCLFSFIYLFTNSEQIFK